jgi:hypothetical protein
VREHASLEGSPSQRPFEARRLCRLAPQGDGRGCLRAPSSLRFVIEKDVTDRPYCLIGAGYAEFPIPILGSRSRGAERRQTRGCARPPVDGRRDHPVGRFAKASPFSLVRRKAPPGAPQRRSATDGPRFRERGPATPVSQLLAPGPIARERSPVIARAPEATFASGPRRRISRRRGFPAWPTR